MARTIIVPDTVATSGAAPTQTTGIADGHFFNNTGKQFVRCLNNDAGSKNFTFITGGTCEGEPITDRVVAVGASAIKYVGPFPIGAWNNASSQVDIDYEDHADAEVEILTLP